MRIKYGVPQGSVVGLVEFICYTEDIEEVLSGFQVGHHLYADDAQLLTKTTLRNIEDCRMEISSCVASIQEWCTARRLQLNPDKTELIWFGSRHLLQQLPPDKSSIQVCGIQVKPLDCVQNLGVLLDNQLTMKAHISKVVSTGFFLCRLKQLWNLENLGRAYCINSCSLCILVDEYCLECSRVCSEWYYIYIYINLYSTKRLDS